jgi:hypothetical protein
MIVLGYLGGRRIIKKITYRTILAFFSESKAITISINMYGEQHIDLLSLGFIWCICIVGLISLIYVLKEKSIGENVDSIE